MYYAPARGDHGLKIDPLKALVVPRPIGWISTVSPAGVVNLAPFSFFNLMSDDPPMVCVGPGGKKRDRPIKDTRANIEATGEFVVNLATWELREAMNATSAELPADTDELAAAGLTAVAARAVRPPWVGESPVQLECRHWRTVELPSSEPDEPNAAVFGEVIGVHVADALIVEGRVDITRARPIARLGYSLYAVIDQTFAMRRP
jgi:flavin reductase (DIM6/NTAB) family NADH-FMN oxidoreductase RutF